MSEERDIAQFLDDLRERVHRAGVMATDLRVWPNPPMVCLWVNRANKHLAEAWDDMNSAIEHLPIKPAPEVTEKETETEAETE